MVAFTSLDEVIKTSEADTSTLREIKTIIQQEITRVSDIYEGLGLKLKVFVKRFSNTTRDIKSVRLNTFTDIMNEIREDSLKEGFILMLKTTSKGLKRLEVRYNMDIKNPKNLDDLPERVLKIKYFEFYFKHKTKVIKVPREEMKTLYYIPDELQVGQGNKYDAKNQVLKSTRIQPIDIEDEENKLFKKAVIKSTENEGYFRDTRDTLVTPSNFNIENKKDNFIIQVHNAEIVKHKEEHTLVISRDFTVEFGEYCYLNSNYLLNTDIFYVKLTKEYIFYDSLRGVVYRRYPKGI